MLNILRINALIYFGWLAASALEYDSIRLAGLHQ